MAGRSGSRVLAWSAAVVVVAGLIGCGDGDDVTTDAGGAPTGEVLVFAAASLTDAFGEMAAAFEDANPGAEVQLNLGGSSALREQVLAGAPADVFASADESTMAEVLDAGEVVGQPEVFARNRLQLAVPAGNPGGVSGLGDLEREDLLVGLCATGVPCGDFARQALAAAGVVPAVDTEEPDVRALLTKVAADELDAGIVYVSDVLAAADRVEGIEIPPAQNVEAAYPIARLAAAPNPAGADAFVAFVRSDEGRSILERYGFAAP